MRATRQSVGMRLMAMVVVLTTTGTFQLRAPALAQIVAQRNEAMRPHRVSELKKGLTQCLTPAQWKAVDAKRAKEAAEKEEHRPDVQPLSLKEMKQIRGRGTSYRNTYFTGALPWYRTLRDVNLCTGNLFKSFTDIEVQTAVGAGLALQRTYNSDEPRIGPFGQGWTHAYDIRMAEEDPSTNETDTTLNYSDRADFLGAKHKYHRDADGLYSPPPYLYDEMSSDYAKFLVNGPIVSTDDTDKGMDGTIKHYIANGANNRSCDYIQDRYGNKTTLAYDTTITLPDGSNPLKTVTDPSGRTLTFHTTNLGTNVQPAYRVVQVDGPLYSVVYTYTTDGFFNLASATVDASNPAGGVGSVVAGNAPHTNRTTTFGYTSVSDGSGNTENGLLSSITDPLGPTEGGHTLSYTYTLTFSTATSSWAAPTNTVWVSSITEPAGVLPNTTTQRTQTWSLLPSVYSNLAGPPSSSGIGTEYYNNVTTGDILDAFVYTDPQLRTVYVHPATADATIGHLVAYDSSNDVTLQEMELYAGGALNAFDNFTYGQHGNVLTASNLGFTGQDTTGWYNASQYFEKQSVTDRDGHTTTMGVGNNQGLDPSNSSTPQNNGNKGNILWVEDAGFNDQNSPSYHKQFTYTYDTYGRKTSQTDFNGVVTTYQYGGPTDATVLVNGSSVPVGNLTTIIQDPTPTPSDGKAHLNRATTLSYDLAGHVTQSVDPMGLSSTFHYNNLGQPTEADFPAKPVGSGQPIATPAETISYNYDANGRTHSVTDNRGTTTMSYEPGSDRVSSVTDPVTGAIGYTYGLAGERLSMTLPGGGTWTYHYDPTPMRHRAEDFWFVLPKDDPNSFSMKPSSILDDQGRRVEIELDIFGHPLTASSNETYTTGSSPTLVGYLYTLYDYAQASYSGGGAIRYSTLQTLRTYYMTGQSTQTLLSQNAYTYDNAGLRLTNQITDPTGAVRTETYGYDDLNRLSSVNYGDGQTQSYTFDPMGNRLSKTDAGGGINGTENYSYDNANMLLTRGSNNYTNDLDGNALTGGGRTNAWDSENRLIQCVNGSTTNQFTYAADGMRHRAVVTSGGVTTTTDSVLDASMLVRDIRYNTQTQAAYNYATYLIGARGPEYRRDDVGGTVRWYLYDGLGSVLGEVDPSGNVTAWRKYDVYGSVRSGGSGSSSQKFVGSLGHESEDNTGLIYMRARYVDPLTGRFVSQDPAKQGINWFSYCSNSPTNKIDASGKDLQDVNGLIQLADFLYKGASALLFSKAVFEWLMDKVLYLLDDIVMWEETDATAQEIEAFRDARAGATTGSLGAELSARLADIRQSLAAEDLGAAAAAKIAAEEIRAFLLMGTMD